MAMAVTATTEVAKPPAIATPAREGRTQMAGGIASQAGQRPLASGKAKAQPAWPQEHLGLSDKATALNLWGPSLTRTGRKRP